jgi:hypothetical protein
MAPAKKKMTSSADRSKRAASSKAKVSGSKPSNRANRSAASTARVTSDANGKASGGTAKVTSSAVREAKQQGKTNVAAAQTRRVAKATMATMSSKLAKASVGRSAASAGRLGVLGAVAAAGLNAGKVADGTLTGAMKRGDYKPKPMASKAENATKADFGKSFKAARAQGSKEFMFKGKRYTTKRKDGR